MSDKRVKVGSGIRLRGKSKPEINQSDGRLVASKPSVEPATPEVAGVFKASQPSVSSTPSPPLPSSTEKITPPPLPTQSQIEQPLDVETRTKSEAQVAPPPITRPSESGEHISKLPVSEAFEENLVKTETAIEVPSIEGIEKSTGNYLLTLGYPGSGKTVLQSFIYYFLATHGAFKATLEPTRKGAQPAHLTQSLLNKWVRDWSDQKFPESTRESVDAIREIRLKLTPRKNLSKSFNFSFVEVSGEIIKSIIPTEVQAGSIAQTMHNFLTAPKSKKMIVYVFNHSDTGDNDELFSSLIQYLETTVSGSLDKYYSLMIVVPNPELVFERILNDERLSRKYSNNRELTPEAMLQYIRLKAPQLVTTYKYWKKSKRGIFKFHIGSVVQNNSAERRLESFDFKDCSRILDFSYEQFHGAKLKETWFTSLKKSSRR